MQDAIHSLPERPDLILVDGNSAPTTPIPCWPVVKGDQHSYVISCASIVAKVLRDSLMEFYHTLWPAYGFRAHKGYGTDRHRRLLRRFGPSVLHRMSFQPVRLHESKRVPATA